MRLKRGGKATTENGQMLCCCYPENMLDVTAYEDFVSTCGVENGFVVADKGFPAGAAAEPMASIRTSTT